MKNIIKNEILKINLKMIQPLNIIPNLKKKSKEQKRLKMIIFPLSKNLKNRQKISDKPY